MERYFEENNIHVKMEPGDEEILRKAVWISILSAIL